MFGVCLYSSLVLRQLIMKLTQKLQSMKEKITSFVRSEKMTIEARNTKVFPDGKMHTIFNAQKNDKQVSQDIDSLYIYKILEILPSFEMNKDNKSNNYRHGKMSYFDNSHNATEFKVIVEKSTNFKVELI